MSAESTRLPYQPDGTVALLAQLCLNPTTDVRCNLEGTPALAVFATPRGCVARRDDRIQALCMQHILTDGMSEGSRLLLDLSVDEAWSQKEEWAPLLHLGYSFDDLNQLLAVLVANEAQIAEPN